MTNSWAVLAMCLVAGAVAAAWPSGGSRGRLLPRVQRQVTLPKLDLGAAWRQLDERPGRSIAVAALGVAVVALLVSGVVAGVLGAIYGALGTRALVRRSVRRRAGVRRDQTLDDLGALAADLRAGLPPAFAASTAPAPTTTDGQKPEGSRRSSGTRRSGSFVTRLVGGRQRMAGGFGAWAFVSPSRGREKSGWAPEAFLVGGPGSVAARGHRGQSTEETADGPGGRSADGGGSGNASPGRSSDTAGGTGAAHGSGRARAAHGSGGAGAGGSGSGGAGGAGSGGAGGSESGGAAGGVAERRIAELTAAVWRLAERTGAPAADLVDRIEADARTADRAHALAAAQAAGAQATAVILTGLPIGGILLGYGIGVAPLPILLHTPLGGGCALGAAALQSLGLMWAERLTAGSAR